MTDGRSATTSRQLGILAAWVALDAAVAGYLLLDGANVTSSVLLLAGLVLFSVTLFRAPRAVQPGSVAMLLVLLVVAHLALRTVVPYRPDLPAPPLALPLVAAVGLVVVVAGAVTELVTGRAMVVAAMALVATGGIAARVVVIAADIPPPFDVPLIQTVAGEALLDGTDPYLSRIYDSGYPYLPIASLAAAIGVVFGDARWPSVAGDALTCISLAVAARRLRISPHIGASAAALWAWSAGGLYVIWQNFPEPVMIGLASLAVAALVGESSRGVLGGALLGLAAATKQFGFGYLPLLPSAGGKGRLALASAAIVALAVIVPFALWHPPEFAEGAFLSHIREPGRAYALNLLTWPAVRFDVPLAAVFLLALAFGWWCTRRVADPMSAWLTGSAGLLLVAFLLNRIAFVNYYAIVLALFLALVLALGRDAATARDG